MSDVLEGLELRRNGEERVADVWENGRVDVRVGVGDERVWLGGWLLVGVVCRGTVFGVGERTCEAWRDVHGEMDRGVDVEERREGVLRGRRNRNIWMLYLFVQPKVCIDWWWWIELRTEKKLPR